ncbi:MAG: YdjY domain-containing protein [Gemmatales bacterium]|nr:YdjY domain-containing protein [Gemmatales bacterium]MDW8222140.1 YdjY domain-containing protein [Gemmatales bacterium]
MIRISQLAFGLAILALILCSVGCFNHSSGGEQKEEKQEAQTNKAKPRVSPTQANGVASWRRSAYGTEAGEWFFSTQVAVGPNVFVQVRQPSDAAIRELAQGALHSLGLRCGPSGVAPLAVLRLLVIRPGDDRQVSVSAIVVLRSGLVEHLLTTHKAEKNHESILSADMDALHLYLALLAIGAKPGKPMEYREENGQRVFIPPQGDRIRVRCAYRNAVGELVIVPAQRWLRDVDKKQTPRYDWVFAGSKFLDPLEPGGKPFFGANLGRVICTSNFNVALLDLPIRSSDQEVEGLLFEANPDAVPPRGTPVAVWLSRLEQQ